MSTKEFLDSNNFDETVKNTFKDSESLKDTLQKLGKLALSGLETNDLCFSRDDLVKTCNGDSMIISLMDLVFSSLYKYVIL